MNLTLSNYSTHKKDLLLLEELAKPAPENFSGFGKSRTVNCTDTECDGSLHPGLDTTSTGDSNLGDPIHATYAGEVVAVGYMNSTLNENGQLRATFGQYVVLQHNVYGELYYSVYAHLEKDNVSVEVGDIVNQGDVIGGMGFTIAQSTVHLHFEIRRATSIDLSQSLPFVIPNNSDGDFFPDNKGTLNANFVNLSSLNWNGARASSQWEQRRPMP